jgi:hypothetical protein
VIFFPAGQHAGVKDGTITVTFRAWDRPRAKAGSLQRSHPIGVIAIDEVTAVELGAVTDEEARKAGLRDRRELVDFVRAKLAEATPSTIVYRIAFRFAGDADFAPTALDAELTAADLASLTASLRAADRSSDPPRPWTRATLDLIAARPRTAASALAADLGRERAAFKADVVKLKKLGLTQSFGVGYDLTPRGRAYLAATASAAESARKSRSTRARKAGSKTPSTRIE